MSDISIIAIGHTVRSNIIYMEAGVGRGRELLLSKSRGVISCKWKLLRSRELLLSAEGMEAATGAAEAGGTHREKEEPGCHAHSHPHPHLTTRNKIMIFVFRKH